MADTAYERITGHPAEVPTPIAVNLVLTDDTLLGGASPRRMCRVRAGARSDRVPAGRRCRGR